MPTSAPRRRERWVGLSTEERQTERHRLLVEAAYDLLGTEGSSGTTVRAVCQHARLNPRYFYESFADLDELLVAVYDHVIEGLRDVVLAATESAGTDPAAVVRATVSAIVGHVDEDRRRGRVLYVEALGNETLNLHRKQTGQALVEAIQHDATSHPDAPPGSEQIGRIGAAVLVGGFSELLANWLDGRIDVSREQLIDDATELFLALGEASARIARKRARA